jgi:hypothetical protein
MSLHPSQLSGVDAATATFKSTSASTTSAKKSTGTSFSAQLKDATSQAETTSKSAPSGEKTTAVSGHMYSDITAGPRKGLFLNTGHNARSGEAFVMVRKNGREYHIYGTGKDRVVIGLKTSADKQSPSTATNTTSDTSTSSSTTGTTDTGVNTDTSTVSGS